MKNILPATLLTVALAIAALLMTLDIHAVSGDAPAQSEVTCELWADVPPWKITRCENWEAGEVCLIANSGMIVCKFE